MSNPNVNFAVFTYPNGETKSVIGWVYRYMRHKGMRPIKADLWNCCNEVLDRVTCSMHPRIYSVTNHGVY